MSIINNPEISLRAIHAVYALTGSSRRAAGVLGVAPSTIVGVLNRAGLPIHPRGRPTTQLTTSTLVAAYWKRGESLRTIGARAGVSHTTVRNLMRELGIPTRDPKGMS